MAFGFENLCDGDAGIKVPPRSSAGDEDMDGIGFGWFHGRSDLGCPTTIAPDHRELTPRNVHTLSVDIDQNTYGNEGGKQTRSAIADKGQGQPLIREQCRSDAHI
jgi:hypothetical protein